MTGTPSRQYYCVENGEKTRDHSIQANKQEPSPHVNLAASGCFCYSSLSCWNNSLFHIILKQVFEKCQKYIIFKVLIVKCLEGVGTPCPVLLEVWEGVWGWGYPVSCLGLSAV